VPAAQAVPDLARFERAATRRGSGLRWESEY
jgi:hypothetical protein